MNILNFEQASFIEYLYYQYLLPGRHQRIRTTLILFWTAQIQIYSKINQKGTVFVFIVLDFPADIENDETSLSCTTYYL